MLDIFPPNIGSNTRQLDYLHAILNKPTNDVSISINVPEVDTIGALRLLTGNSNDVIAVRGYYEIGDTVMPNYYWDATSVLDDNGGTIIKATPTEVGRWIAFSEGIKDVKQFGLKGISPNSDTSGLQQTINHLSANGGGVLTIPSGEYFTGRPVSEFQRGVRLKPGVSYVGNGMPVLNLNNNAEFIFIGSEGENQIDAIIDEDTTTSQNFVHVNSVAGLEVGKVVFVRLGQAAYDAFEPDWFFYGVIKNINPSTKIVTFDRPLGYALDVSAVTDTNQRKLIQIDDLIENIEVKNLYLKCDPTNGSNAESGIYIQYGRNLRIDNVKFYNPGSAALNIQFAENVQCNNLHIERSEKIQGQASKGRCLSLAESNNVRFENVMAQEFEGDFAVLEGKNLNITFNNIAVYNTFSDVERTVFALLGQGDIYVYNLMVGGYPMKLVEASFLFGKCIVENLTVLPNTFFYFQEQFGAFVKGSIQIGIGANATIYERKTFSIKYPLDKPINQHIALPRGRYANYKFVTNSLTGFTQLRFARDSSNSNNGDNIIDPSTVNTAKEGAFTVWINPPLDLASQLNYNDNKALLINCDGTAAKGSHFVLTVDYFAIPVDGGEEEVITYKDYTEIEEVVTSTIVAQDVSQSVGGITTDATFVTYTTPDDGSVRSYRVGADVAITNLNGSSVKLRVSFTDVNGNAVTQDYYPMGAISSVLNTGFAAMPSVTISAAHNTTISVQMVFTSAVGGVIYFGHGVIEDLGVVFAP